MKELWNIFSVCVHVCLFVRVSVYVYVFMCVCVCCVVCVCVCVGMVKFMCLFV